GTSEKTAVLTGKTITHLLVRGAEDALYAVTDAGALLKCVGGAAVPLGTLPVAVDYAMDYAGNVFALQGNTITRYNAALAAEAAFTVVGDRATAVVRTPRSLSINLQAHEGPVGYGDVVLADGGADCVFVVSGAALGAVTFDEGAHVHPNEPTRADVLEVRYPGGAGVWLYAYPDAGKPMLVINPAWHILVLQYDLAPQNDHFSYVLIEITTAVTLYETKYEQTLLSGYVLKRAMTARLPDLEPPYPVATALHEATAVYRYPFVYADVVTVLPRGTDLPAVPFPYPYIDRTDSGFIAVRLPDDTVGYVPATSLTRKNYLPAQGDKYTDAQIITDNLLGAPLYRKVNGQFVAIDEPPLKNGTRVKLVENKVKNGDPYTEIIYYEGDAQLQAWVETRFIDPDSHSYLQVAALIIAVVTVVAGAAALAVWRKKKRDRL
ncbi:MAG: hypothetical protein LBM78_02475, partial [Clostridiales bacterium]|nr:hypothetical protein [Clostridiales bacterium]